MGALTLVDASIDISEIEDRNPGLRDFLSASVGQSLILAQATSQDKKPWQYILGLRPAENGSDYTDDELKELSDYELQALLDDAEDRKNKAGLNNPSAEYLWALVQKIKAIKNDRAEGRATVIPGIRLYKIEPIWPSTNTSDLQAHVRIYGKAWAGRKGVAEAEMDADVKDIDFPAGSGSADWPGTPPKDVKVGTDFPKPYISRHPHWVSFTIEMGSTNSEMMPILLGVLKRADGTLVRGTVTIKARATFTKGDPAETKTEWDVKPK